MSALKISSWNVRGFGDVFKGTVVCHWINRFHRDLDMIGLQELKAKMESIEFQRRLFFQIVSPLLIIWMRGELGRQSLFSPTFKFWIRGLREMEVWLGV